MATSAAPARRAGTWLLLVVLSANMLVDAIEVSTVIVAMPSVGLALGVPLAGAQWTLTAFALGFGGSLLAAGRVVAIHGRRRIFIGALAVFAVASVVSALADGIVVLAAARLLKGICVALTAPTGLAIIVATFREGPARTRAVSVYSFAGASGFTVGLILSGILTGLSWRWTLALPALFAVALLLLSLRVIPADQGTGPGRGYDARGALILMAAPMLCVVALTQVPGHGWSDPRVVLPGVTAAGLLGLLARLERSAVHPLFDLGLPRHPVFLASALGAAALNGSFWGLLVITTYDLQSGAGWAPLGTALAMLPASLLLVLAVRVSGPLITRFGAGRLIAAGALFPPIGYAWYLQGGPAPNYFRTILPTMVLTGLGFALGFAALHLRAVGAVPPAARGTAGITYQTAVQLGGAVAVATVVALTRTAAEAGPADFRPALILVTVLGCGGLVAALAGLRAHARSRAR